MFLLEYTVMLLLITSVKVRLTRTCMCEISSILLKFCAKFRQTSKMFVIPPQISSIFSPGKEWQPCRDRRELCKVKYFKVLIKIANKICKTIKFLIRPHTYLGFEEKELEKCFIYGNVKY